MLQIVYFNNKPNNHGSSFYAEIHTPLHLCACIRVIYPPFHHVNTIKETLISQLIKKQLYLLTKFLEAKHSQPIHVCGVKII